MAFPAEYLMHGHTITDDIATTIQRTECVRNSFGFSLFGGMFSGRLEYKPVFPEEYKKDEQGFIINHVKEG